MFDNSEILIFGDHHRSRPQHMTFCKILKFLKSINKNFAVYLEIPSTSQKKMDSVIFGDNEYTEVFWNHKILRDYGYETIVNTCKRYKIPVICFDAGHENRNFEQREKYMSDMLINSKGKVLCMVGGYHLEKSKNLGLYDSKSVLNIQMWDVFREGWNKFEKAAENNKKFPIMLKCEDILSYDYDLVIPYNKNLYIPHKEL